MAKSDLRLLAPGGGGSKNSKSIGCRAAAARLPAKQTPLRVASTFSQYFISKTSNFLRDSEVAALSQTCRLFNQRSQPALSHRMATYAQRLLEYVVRGEQDEAEKLLEKNPKLLLSRTGDTVDYSGRRIKGITAWQVALCAGDVEMLQMMSPYFEGLTQVEKNKAAEDETLTDFQIRDKQTSKIFPKGFEAHLAQQEASTFNFNALVAAIGGAGGAELQSAIDLKGAVLRAAHASPEKTNAGVACQLTTELNKFRQAFTTQSLKEPVFNPQYLLRALEIYNAQYGGWDYKKRQVFWSQVVGFTQRFMPACYAQAFAQGLHCLTKESNPEPLKRSLSLRYGGGKIFSDGGGFLDLGFKFGLRQGSVVRWCAMPFVRLVLGASKSYVKQKQATLRTYARARAADPAGTLVALSR